MKNTDTQTNENLRFTGGDNLTGLKAKLHQTFMQTELNNGYGAYKVSYAENKSGGNSGITYGGNQMDLSTEKELYIKTFINILKNAKDYNGNRILPNEEVTIIEKNPSLTTKGLKPEAVFGQHLNKVNAALASDYGRAEINKMYVSEINEKIKHVENAINKISNPKNRAIIASSDEWKVRLADYHNQFGLNISDDVNKAQLLNFLSGKEVTLINYEYNSKGKKEPCGGCNLGSRKARTHYLQLQGEPTLDEFVRFLRATDQYNKSPKGLDNRLEKIDKLHGTLYADKSRNNDKILLMERIELGDSRDCSIDLGDRDNHAFRSLTANFNLDLKRLISCNADIKFDDHARVTLNGNFIFNSIDNLGTELRVFQKDKVNYVSTGKTEVPAETSRSSTKLLNLNDFRQFLRPGNNSLTLDVIVQHQGCIYMKVQYSHSSQNGNRL